MADMADNTPAHAVRPRSFEPEQKAVLALLIAVVAVILVAYGAAASYDNLWHLALARGVPLPRLMPVGLDGGLIGTVALDLALTWAGYPLWWLRWIARLFAFATIAANALAGWPNPVGMFLRMAAPALIVVITEAVRAVLLKRRREIASDRIPGARWLLAPRQTFAMWKRMKLWNITVYSKAVTMELARLRAIEALADYYKTRDWRALAPGSLVWMLDAGVHMDDALAAVAVLTAPPEASPEQTPKARQKPRQTSRQNARQKPRQETAAAREKAKRLMTDDWTMPLADVAAQTGLSERTVSRVRSQMPRPLRSTG